MRAQYHIETTRTVLGTYFGPDALQEIIAANLGQDSVASILGADPHRHFCAKDLAQSMSYLESEHALIGELAGQPNGAAAQRAAFGRLLHTAQDFYAHSNYVHLWLAANGGAGVISPHRIDSLDDQILNHGDLRLGEWIPWRDMIYYIPLLGALARSIWVPVDSHEAMHLDSPDRGPQFAYALAAARQRTAQEYHRAIKTIAHAGGEPAVRLFQSVHEVAFCSNDFRLQDQRSMKLYSPIAEGVRRKRRARADQFAKMRSAGVRARSSGIAPISNEFAHDKDLAPIRDRHLHIAFFLEGMSTSGVDTSTKQLAETLRLHGHRVALFAPWAESGATDTDGDLFRLPGVCVDAKQEVYWSYPLSMRLIAKFMREEFDLIHVHTSTSVNVLVWQISKLFDLPVVYTYHTMSTEYTHYLGPLAQTMGGFVDSAVKLFDRLICNAADVVVTPSRKAADYLAEIDITPPVKVIPNGVNLSRFSPDRSDFLRRLLDIPADQRIVLFVGRLNQEKRPVEAYAAFRELAARRSDLCLVMAGHGPLAAALHEMAAQDGLAERVHLPGALPYEQMPQVYQSADVWVSTSTSEVHPMVALEACACGLPSVVMADRALEGVVVPGQNGFVVNSQPDFVSRLEQLLDDGDLRLQMGTAAVQQATHFDIENTAQQLCHVYKSVIKRK